MTSAKIAQKATDELSTVLQNALPAAIDIMAPPILNAQKIALYGVGREGLMIKALAMRLFHLGLNAHVIGDMTMPHMGQGDLFIASAGPGHFSTVDALMAQAKSAGAATLIVTATPDGPLPKRADHLVHIPAQTMANDAGKPTSILPMGSLFEAAMFMLFEVLILDLRDRLNRSAEEMRGFHTNME